VAPCTFPFEDAAFDLVLLFTVLTSSPGDREQRAIIDEARRVLRTGGFLYVSDMPLQTDRRNLERYDRYVQRYGIYGVFEVEDGAVVRHHDMALVRALLGGFEQIGLWEIDVETMNGHRARAFQYIGRKD
jgi:SAM-dependent methyltransferase